MDTIESLAPLMAFVVLGLGLLGFTYRIVHNHFKTLEKNLEKLETNLGETNEKIDDNYKDLLEKIDSSRVELTQRMDAGFSEIRGVLWTLIGQQSQPEAQRNPEGPLALPKDSTN